MRKTLSILCAAAMAVTSLAGSATAASASAPGAPFVVEAQYRGDSSRTYRRGDPRVERWTPRNRAQQRRGFWRDGDRAYYNGHRGYRERRAGYRYHNGYWFPAFLFGAIIGHSIAQPPVVVRPGQMSPAHVSWCSTRYRSYRQWDNTFQPYHGPRRICVSPYS